ncbi:MAG TPA: hypothetical protein P5089_01190 [Candidatus Portnoybacteria bacterium]|nr:hypothetical protein [Candidatus Portnoybacteria bacterium]
MSKCSCQCLACGRDFEAQATIQEKEEEKIVCPGCGSKNIKQKFSAVNFVKNIFDNECDCGCSDKDGRCETGADKKDENTKSGGCCCGS